MENCYNVHNLYLEFLFFVTDSLWKECQSVSQTLTRVSIMIMGGGGGGKNSRSECKENGE